MGEPLRGHSGCVWTVAFSGDGAFLASGSFDNTIRLWNAASSALNMVSYLPPSPTLQLSLRPAWSTDLHNGWIKGPNNELILWVPPSYRNRLYDERLIGILGQDMSSRARFNFDNMTLGEDWASCHTPSN
ncbi:hypothetical protein DL93DRAFT_2122224, partial [Clavulina sp. PMI_390]